MKSIEWIELLIKERKLPSHRQAALLIGMAEPLMSKHRNGKAVTLDDKYAYKLEELLKLPHGKIVADQHAERASDPNISAMWRKLASTAAALTLVFCGLSIFCKPADASTNYYNSKAYLAIHYAQQRMSVLRAPRAMLDNQVAPLRARLIRLATSDLSKRAH